MAEDDDDDKQYAPSQKKLDDARKKGEIPRSQDLNTAASYAGLLLAGAGLGGASLIGAGEALMTLIDRPESLSRLIFDGSGGPVSASIIVSVAMPLLPLLAAPAIMVILALVVTRSFVVAPDKIMPKLNKISPLAQAKNKFGRGGLFEFGKSFVKLVIYGVILGVFLSSKLPDILSSMALSPAMATAELLKLALTFLFIVLLVSLTIGGIDFGWQWAEHMRKHRMSHQEMKDEHKQMEGDPHVKQQRRQKGYDIAMNQMMADVPEADVVIVNPTHYAIALKWDRMRGSAPTCVAKGVDEIALRIREVASENGVAIHRDVPTARALHATVEIGEEVRPEHYKAVAAAIRFAEKMRTKARR